MGGARTYFGAPGVAVLFAISAGFSCKKSEPSPPPEPPAATKDFTAGLPAQAPTLDGQLAAEAAARRNDADTIRIEDVIGSLGDGGIAFGTVRQVMARKQLAIYCGTAEGPDGVVLSVCEYPSTEAAVNGEREANLLGAKVAGHVSRAHKKSVLHLIKKSTTPDETVQKILAAFNGA